MVSSMNVSVLSTKSIVTFHANEKSAFIFLLIRNSILVRGSNAHIDLCKSCDPVEILLRSPGLCYVGTQSS